MPRLSDLGLALLVFAGSVGLLLTGRDHGEVTALAIGVTALASLPLAFHRRAPVGVFVFTAAASIALRALDAPEGPPLGPTVALYFAVLAGPTRRLAVLAGALLVAHLVAMGLATDSFPATPIAFGVVVWGGAWLAADRTRLRHERFATLEQRARTEERTRIARDLHDSAGHALNVILVHAGLGRVSADDPAAREAFTTIEDVARQTVADIDQRISEGSMMYGTPDDVMRVAHAYEAAGADQVVFGLLSSTMPRDIAVETIETFGRHVLPEFDRDPVHRTTRQREAQVGAGSAT